MRVEAEGEVGICLHYSLELAGNPPFPGRDVEEGAGRGKRKAAQEFVQPAG